MEPEESKYDIFSSTPHDIEEMFLGNSFNVYVEGAGVMNCTGLICGLVYVLDSDGGSEFLGGKSMFSDKLPVDAGDICIRVY